MSGISRRHLLKLLGLAAGARSLGLTSFSALPLLAQTAGASDYKALVCIFLLGGNDGNNLLIPADSAGFSLYQQIRGAVALSPESLLSLGSASPVFLNAAMPNFRASYLGGIAAFVANVGPLVQNVSRAAYLAGSAELPLNLFSHRDQQIGWQSAEPAISGTSGWAGRIADTFPSNSSAIPAVISVSGNSIFLDGLQSTGMSISASTTSFATQCSQSATVCAARSVAMQQLVSLESGATLIQADNAIAANALQYFKELNSAMRSAAPLKTNFDASNPLAVQLEQVARVLSIRAELGASRQIFFASLGSFDTHADQLAAHASLLSQLDSALASFQQAVSELGIENDVTSFTMSDFGRAMVPNSLGGTDHAWGSHHIVLGGAVKGGALYGAMPQMILGGPDDAGSDGRWIPTLSASQYTATLASWFGVSSAAMPQVIPNIGNFAATNLGFMLS